MEWVIAGASALLLCAGWPLLIRANRKLGEALTRVEIRDEQIASLLDQNEKLRAPIESARERAKSAAAELAARGLSDTPPGGDT